MFKALTKAAPSIKLISKKTSIGHPLVQMGLFQSRQIVTFSEALDFALTSKEVMSIASGLVGYGLNRFLARQAAMSKRLILVVRRAEPEDMPANFDSIMKGAAIDSQDTEGNSALHYACEKGHRGIVQELLSMGANPDLKNKRGETAFYLASFAGHTSVIDIFIDVATQYRTGVYSRSKISISEIVNQRTANQWTPLLAAVFNNHKKVIRRLMNFAVIEDKNYKGESALFLAAMNNNAALVKHILFNTDIPNKQVMHLISHQDDHEHGTPLYVAAEKGYVDIVKLLLRRGAKNTPAGKNRQTPLHVALLQGNDEIVMMLSQTPDAYIYTTPDGWSIFDYVILCAERRQEVSASERVILDIYCAKKLSFIDKIKLSRIPFYKALNGSTHPIVIQKTLDECHDNSLSCLAIANHPALILQTAFDTDLPNMHGYTALHDAIFFGSMAAVDAFIEIDADIESPRQDGSSPLLTAALFKRTDIALYLIQCGANINSANDSGRSAMYYAIINNDLKLAEKLCEKRIDLRHVDKQGHSYLHHVANRGSAEMASLLLQNGALRDPKTDHFKNFPTHIAVIAKNSKVLQVLLEYDSDPDARNINNLTPQQLAQDNDEIINMLDRARAMKMTPELGIIKP